MTLLHLRAQQDVLSGAITDAVRALPLRPSIPVLNSVLVAATTDGRVEVVGYDFDVCIRSSFSADVLEPGQVLVPGRALAGFLAGMPYGTVDVELHGSRLNVTTPRVRCGLPTLALDDYPALPPLPPTVGTLPATDLSRVLGKVIAAGRPVAGLEFSGVVQVLAASDRLTISATDRYTVGIASVAWDGPSVPVVAQVTGKALTDALRTMNGDVSVCLDDTGIGLATAGRTFSSRRLAVDFPPCQAIAERIGAPTSRILLRADELASAMAAGARVVTEDRRPVRLSASPDGVLSYQATSEGGNDLAGDLDVEQIAGEPVVFGVNPQYLADALKPLGDAVVELGVRGPRKALTVTVADAPGDIHLIQPVHLP